MSQKTQPRTRRGRTTRRTKIPRLRIGRELLFPRWAFWVYLLSALVLAPWAYSIAWFLPTTHVARNWDIAWVGFDIFMLLMFIATIWFAVRGSVWSLLTSMISATLLVIDAWFDVLTAAEGTQRLTAAASACLELGLAGLMVYIVVGLVRNLRSELRIQKN